MLFNSYEFIFGLLPIIFLVYYFLLNKLSLIKVESYKKLVNIFKLNNIKFIPFITPISAEQFSIIINNDKLYLKFLKKLVGNGTMYYFHGINEYITDKNLFLDSYH